ncbi:MAG: sugar ABC transporter ATP-binding protein [Eubacteriales bacterium]|nr:sugar ABC transporter ATP-binding protein [Eubacteriales bacterium]
MSGIFFEVRNISKSFPGVKALDSVSMSINRGEVRALVGENGAGKTTLMKVLNGNYKADSGALFIDGCEVCITDPTVAAHMGISIIFQELNLVNGLSIAENIFAGRLSEGGRPIRWREIRKKAKEYLDRIGFNIDPKIEVGKLSVAGKQMVEIAKALSYNAQLILMDEPSASLTQNELEKLFAIIRDLKQKGIAVIYISHRLEEIFSICDSVTVMRDGEIIGTSSVQDVTKNRLVEMMVGREINQAFPQREHHIQEEVLRVENLMRKGGKAKISFNLHRGEVLGIAGLVGAGRTEAMRALYGVDYIAGGSVFVKGKKLQSSSPRAAKDAGIAFLTEDRKDEGLTIDFSIKSNIVMANLKKIVGRLFLSNAKENAIADEYIQAIKIKTPSRTQKVLNLSGGNQQKVVVAKWFNTDSDIIIMDEPTRGIDVGAKYEIYEIINDLVSHGKAVIMISSELPEVLGMSDRVLVMKSDAIVAELTGERINAVDIMNYAF